MQPTSPSTTPFPLRFRTGWPTRETVQNAPWPSDRPGNQAPLDKTGINDSNRQPYPPRPRVRPQIGAGDVQRTDHPRDKEVHACPF